MQEFASISAETPVMLTEQLNAKAADGWSLVSIHTHNGSLVAFLSRSTTSTAAPAATQPVAVVEAAPAAAAVNEPAGWASAPAATPAAAPAAAPAAQAAQRGAAIPANWYPDPSGRFDLRYWDGSQWTEHVSRAGQQFVDPPVA